MVEMYRFLFRPLWILFHVVVAAAIILMVNLGFWQLDRLDERQTFNRQVIERSQQAPLPLADVLDEIERGDVSTDEAEWLPVTVAGSFLPDQIVEFNQSQGGRAGENVLAALAVDDGTTVIVNRGFIPLGFEVPAAPATEVSVTGLIRMSEVRDRGGLTDSADGPVDEVRRIDIPFLAQQLPGDVAPVYVQLVSSEPSVTVGDPEPISRPELDSGPHLSYAIQWFIFSLAVAVGWVLAVRRSLATRRRALAAEQAVSPAAADERTAVGSG
jgi:cytochrome oxidase assembly protein ShyY1